jgi:hypothetical protein
MTKCLLAQPPFVDWTVALLQVIPVLELVIVVERQQSHSWSQSRGTEDVFRRDT